MSRLVIVAVTLLAAVAALLVGCNVTGTVYSMRDDRNSYEVGLAPTVSVETFNGRINVTAAGDGKVEVRVSARGAGTSQAAADRDVANVLVSFEQEGNRVIITARQRDRSASTGNSGADIEVGVPEQSSLELRTSNGRIETANVTGSILAITSNGAITTRGGNDLALDTSNGPVSVNGATGTLVVRTSNGALDIIGARDVLVSAETSNAPLSFSGSLLRGDHTFRTKNGALTLTLPGDAVFSIDGSTTNGAVRTDFDLIYTASTIRGWVGDFIETFVTAQTSNGDLAVMTIRP